LSVDVGLEFGPVGCLLTFPFSDLGDSLIEKRFPGLLFVLDGLQIFFRYRADSFDGCVESEGGFVPVLLDLRFFSGHLISSV
jgi:hypothetical protein